MTDTPTPSPDTLAAASAPALPGGASQTPAVVLLSGGLDSATVLAIARHAGHACHCLSFDYGQRHRAELAAATAVADQLGAVTHRTAAIDLRAFGGSALTSDTIDVPKDRDADAIADGIPVTYVPARNTVFLSYALALAEVLDAGAIYLGINAVDYSGYPDCRPEYLAAFQAMADLATKAGVEGRGVRIHAPLLTLTKPQIIQCGLDLGVDYALTHSCYDPIPDPSHPLGYRPCGQCDACLLRKAAFEKLGMTDPVLG